ncbi:antA/AntB antirepressor family protein [Corynebacterium marquesiae]|uniref:antA/AntB antirepressor family protein n=1 Tax=Corynebacterium marquesiae TaxID=2913503 RepID=UPI00255043D2|nr:antA/AntB antirepressor family protein [Corynebacterium marquesiae]MDK8496830.1 antA/AntB antirepressor family protein [Corynebacterium marquesiae]
MNELIPIHNNNGAQAVMGRDLHAFLESKEAYTRWISRLIEKYGFVAGQDFMTKMSESTGGRPSENHILTLDMAKEISMVQNNDKGRQARRYFIECERRAKEPVQLSPEELMARAIKVADSTIKELEAKTRELEPAAKSWTYLAAPGGDYSVAGAAKTLSRDPNISIGRNKLFDFMREQRWIFRTSGKRAHWEAYQDKGINTGRLVHKLSSPFMNERTGEWEQPAPTIRITPKGLHELHKLLGGSEQAHLAVV